MTEINLFITTGAASMFQTASTNYAKAAAIMNRFFLANQTHAAHPV